jgi:hypothetical protein
MSVTLLAKPAPQQSPEDVRCGQLLSLARTANVVFDVQDGRLVACFAGVDWKLWPAVRAYLDEIGIETLAEYFRRTTPEERAVLSAAA